MAVNADTSIGYKNTIDSVAMARWNGFLGSDPCVSTFGDLACAATGTGDRAVTVSPGTAFGWGILDTFSSPTNLNLAPVTAAVGIRWDTICVHRDWTVGSGAGLTSLVAVQGGSAQAVAAGIAATPGGIADQPIALAQVVYTPLNGSPASAISRIMLLAPVLSSRQLVYPSKPALLAMPASLLAPGQPLAYVGTHQFRRQGGTWIDLDNPAWANVALSGTAGTLVAGPDRPILKSREHHGMAQLMGSAARSNGTNLAEANVLTQIGTLPGALVPEFEADFAMAISQANSTGTAPARCQILPTGAIQVFNRVDPIVWGAFDGMSWPVKQFA